MSLPVLEYCCSWEVYRCMLESYCLLRGDLGRVSSILCRKIKKWTVEVCKNPEKFQNIEIVSANARHMVASFLGQVGRSLSLEEEDLERIGARSRGTDPFLGAGLHISPSIQLQRMLVSYHVLTTSTGRHILMLCSFQ